MAQTTSKTFTILSIVMALLLLGSAGVVYLQSQSAGGGHAALAALSQALPRHAADAAAGKPNGFEQLDNDTKRLAQLTSAAGTPGRQAQWRALEQSAAALLAQRAYADSVAGAITSLQDRVPKMVEASNALLDQSGATASIQEFQTRAQQLQQSVQQIADATDPAALASSISEDLTFLRQVTDGLAGNASDLDLVALDEATRDTVLTPIVSELTEIEQQVGGALAATENLGDLDSLVAAVAAAGDDLFADAFPESSTTSGLLALPWIPIALVLGALLLLAALYSIYAKSAVFERTSIVQSQQNERNQQAILRLLDELGSLADGDLTVEATVTEDITGAIADSINYAIEKLRELVATINETAIMVDSAAKQTENTATHMARAADNQGLEINAATESIVSMAASIEEVSGNAERSSDVARHSVEVAHKGGEAVRRTIDGMNTIRETIQDTSKRIKRLGESSQEIGNIVELINDIAEQTNILALNASIQASMAGEAGRGFAVVADEVQRLAERSTNATKQIEVLVRTIQADTNEAVVSMERSTTDVVGGALLAENAGAALDEIEQVSNQIANLVQNISGSARQQASSAADVTRRTTKLKEISGQTGKATTATAAAISKLSELASQLRQTVAGFTLPSAALKASPLSSVSAAPPAAPPVATKDQAAG